MAKLVAIVAYQAQGSKLGIGRVMEAQGRYRQGRNRPLNNQLPQFHEVTIGRGQPLTADGIIQADNDEILPRWRPQFDE
jgi:hypothetical protein